MTASGEAEIAVFGLAMPILDTGAAARQSRYDCDAPSAENADFVFSKTRPCLIARLRTDVSASSSSFSNISQPFCAKYLFGRTILPKSLKLFWILPRASGFHFAGKHYMWPRHEISFPPRAARFRSRRDLGVRSRQHALSASPQSLAAGGRAHPRLHREIPQGRRTRRRSGCRRTITSATAPRCAG